MDGISGIGTRVALSPQLLTSSPPFLSPPPPPFEVNVVDNFRKLLIKCILIGVLETTSPLAANSGTVHRLAGFCLVNVTKANLMRVDLFLDESNSLRVHFPRS